MFGLFGRRISLYGLLNSKVYFDHQNVSWRKIWKRLKEKYAEERNKTQKQISQSFELVF